MKKLVLVALIALGFSLESSAQQDPHYTQYMYNMSVMNPAYAGSKENLSMGLLYRKQWIEIEDAPTTATFFGHSPVGKNVGLGLSVVSDKLGPVEENNVFGDFSYTLNLGENHKLALGLKAGLTFQKIGLLSDVDPSLQDNLIIDPAFGQNVSNTFFNVGSGVFFYSQKYYVGFSIPNFLKKTHMEVNSNGTNYEFGPETAHYFLTGGYVFDLNETIKFKPFFMLKSAFGVNPSLDVSSNFLFNNKFEIGGTYRLQDSFGAMMNYAITPNLRIGYAYDHIVSDLKVTTPSSHEIILLFDLNFPKKVSSSPRFF